MRYITALFITLLPLLSLQASDILPAEKAFVPTLSIQNNQLHVDFKIEDDYYMYKDKTSIVALGGAELGEVMYSSAKIKDDPFFGKVDVYRKTANMNADIQSASDVLRVEVLFQGCWDGGVCYPPIRQVHTISYTASASLILPQANASSAKSNFFKSLTLDDSIQDPVSADMAFALTATKIDETTLNLYWDIRKDYYLYTNKFNFEIEGGDFGTIDFPKGKLKQDDFFGEVDVYYNNLSIDVPIKSEGEVVLTLSYQGCWEGGVCYPPLTKQLGFDFGSTQESAASTTSAPVSTPQEDALAIGASIESANTSKSSNSANSTSESAPLNAQDEVTELLKNSSVWAIIGVFFLFGLALSFTPCVLPMIPILSNIIVGQGDITKQRAFFLSLVFVLAMAITYTVAGVIAGSLDINFIIMFQNPYIVSAFALVFVALAFSMFGYFELKLPNFLNTRLTNISNKQKGGDVIGVAVMGLLSALIVGPCVAPPLAGSLLFISQTGDAALGGTALFAMGMGMGVPLLVIGSGVGSLPKAGGWMDNVKYLFGVLMLGVAIWMLDKILDPDVIILLWAVLLTIAPIALGATIAVKSETSYAERMYRGFLLIVLGYGILLLLLVARGGTSTGGSLLDPLAGMSTGGTSTNVAMMSGEAPDISFNTVLSQEEIDTVLAGTDKMVMLDFYADWCVYCKVYEERVFPSSRVAPILANFELLKLDMTDYTDIHKGIMKGYDVFAPPAILFFQGGKELRSKRIVGELDESEFYEHIKGL